MPTACDLPRPGFLKKCALLGAVLAAGLGSVSRAAAPARPPNVVIIFCDDLGYADIGPFGAQGYATPHLDRMAREGIRLTQFYVSSGVCSASRAALLTGSYHNRVSIRGALNPRSEHGINPAEMTMAELLKQRNYATAIFGKWHLGHHPEFLPLQHGFDEFFGIPYSNDMWPYHPEARPGTYPPLPLFEGNRIANPEMTPADQEQLTVQITERAVDFIARNRDRPFFLYVPHPQPHVPLFASERFRGKTERGLFGDVIAELDWSVGEILGAVRRHGLDDNTLVIFTSDNGPWLSYGDHAGSAEPLREGKGTSWDGGVRVPFVARWPGRIAAGRTSGVAAMTIDLLPTLARLAGARLPNLPIDGRDIWPLLEGTAFARPPRSYAIYYAANELQAVIRGEWKLIFPHRYRTLEGRPGGTGGIPVRYGSADSDLELYHLRDDIGESNNLAARRPDVVRDLQAEAERYRADLGDSLTGRRTGPGIRPAGQRASAAPSGRP